MRNLPSRFGIAGGIAAAAVSVVLLPPAMMNIEQVIARGSWQSALYALWEQTFAVGMFLALLVFFRRFLNWPSLPTWYTRR